MSADGYSPPMARHPIRELQELDIEANGLRAERAGLPERHALRDNRTEQAALGEQRVAAAAALGALEQEERQLEAEVTDAAARAKSVEDDLYSGRVSASKELAALQTDLEGSRSRLAALEERELELMEAVEAATADLANLDARSAEIETVNQALAERVAAAEARIDAALERLEDARSGFCAQVEVQLLAAYEKRRLNERLAGHVTTELVGNKCGRCKVTLPITEVTRLKGAGPDAFVVCASCHRLILPMNAGAGAS